MNRPKRLTKLPIPSILKESDARDLRDDLMKRMEAGELLWVDLDEVTDFDLAGFNALVAPYYHSLEHAGELYLQLRDNAELMDQFLITRLDFILNTSDASQ